MVKFANIKKERLDKLVEELHKICNNTTLPIMSTTLLQYARDRPKEALSFLDRLIKTGFNPCITISNGTNILFLLLLRHFNYGERTIKVYIKLLSLLLDKFPLLAVTKCKIEGREILPSEFSEMLNMKKMTSFLKERIQKA